MANFYIDTPALRLNLKNDLMKRIVELKERNYTDRGKYDYAPIDFADAIDSYDKVLEIAGEICGDIIAPALPMPEAHRKTSMQCVEPTLWVLHCRVFTAGLISLSLSM